MCPIVEPLIITLSTVSVVSVPTVVTSLVLPVVITVPVASGNVIVLSAVGSVTVNAVSFVSSVAPSNAIIPVSYTHLTLPTTPYV